MAVADTKKPSSGPKKTKTRRAYPSFYEMTSDAISTLKERTGSSQYAIAKFIEDKHAKNQLPSNFKRLLLIQLKKFVASGKLLKVKNSYKIPSAAPSAPAKKPVSGAAKPKVSKPKGKVAEGATKKRKASEDKAKPKAAAKVAKTSAKASPGAKPKKKVAATPKKKVAVSKAPKPKSVKSPAKKKAAPKKTSK